ncbi:ATP-binding protein [Rhizobium binxianense]
MQALEFGSFRLFPSERRLVRQAATVPLGDRALDLLVILVENAGRAVSKQRLVAHVWPDTMVEESSLRAHIAALRRVLGDGKDRDRYIANIAGRGYSFVHHVERVDGRAALKEPVGAPAGSLPGMPARMIGRENDRDAVGTLLSSHRFVTVHGAGGIGKTTVALAVAHGCLDRFQDGVRFLDLGLHGGNEAVPDVLAAALGQVVQSDDPTSGIIDHLQTRRMLLIFDCCEHVIGSAAALAEAIFEKAPDVSILATSREPLRVEGEHVYALPPLDFPSEGVDVTSGNLLDYSAARFLVERAAAGGYRIEMGDGDARIVADICRKVDGIALALELTARRISTHGLRETASLLDSRFALSWQGRRTAPPRHQTLHAMLDWGHGLLLERERVVLRRLSIFVGPFTLAEAQAVAAEGEVGAADVVEALAQLVSKSLVLVDPSEKTTRYRLLDATCAYAGARLAESGEEAGIASRHALYYRRQLSPDSGAPAAGMTDITHLGNIRAALEWSFSEAGDTELGLRLAAGAAPLFLGRSLLTECIRWCERALATLPPGLQDTPCEMALRAALGHALMFVAGNAGQTRTLIERALDIAEALGDDIHRFQLLSSLHVYHRRTGDFSQLLAIARRAEAVAASLADGTVIAAADVMVGVSHHLTGNLAGARAALDMALLKPPMPRRTRATSLDLRSEAQFVLARNAWLQGYPSQSMAMLLEAEREKQEHPLATCHALLLAAGIFHFRRDWETFERYIDRLIQYADEYCLCPYKSVGAGFKGEVFLRRGDAESGLGMIKDALVRMRAENFEIYASWLDCALAEGMAARGHPDQALAIMNEVIGRTGRGGDVFNMPELLRIRGELLAGAGAELQAEHCFRRSVAMADVQGALSWRLRTMTSFARLRSRQHRHDAGRTMLAETYARFTEGFDTGDLKAAKLLLDDLGGKSGCASAGDERCAV